MNEQSPPANAASPYSAEDRQRWRQLLLEKGGAISKMLEELLARKEVDLQTLELKLAPAPGEEKEPKEKRLRRYFDFLMRRMRATNDPRFGFDSSQARFLTVAELDEVPWADVEP